MFKQGPASSISKNFFSHQKTTQNLYSRRQAKPNANHTDETSIKSFVETLVSLV